MANYAIELKNITKKFGSVVANDKVNLNVKKGEIHALLGENGSGKTTLMNMIAGIYRPDKGQVFVNGQKVYIDSPQDAKKLGIGMVHQHFKLIEKYSVEDNIWLGYENEPYGLNSKLKDISKETFNSNKFKDFFIKFGKYVCQLSKGFWHWLKNCFLSSKRSKAIEDFAKKYSFNIDAKKIVADMAVSEKQTVEILKVLFYGAKILILDEPTAVLTVQEIDKLFSVLRKMRDDGCAIVIITHKLNEVMAISDRVSILRKGEYIATVDTAQTNEKQLTEMMVGAKVDLNLVCEKTNYEQDLLVIDNLEVKNSFGINAIDGLSLKLKSGEILGIAGISGSGQKELCEAIAGLENISGGNILYQGNNIAGKSPLEIIKMGISMSFIPEDRLGMGLAGSMNIVDNMMLKSYRDSKGFMPKAWMYPFVDRKSASKLADKVVQELDVKTPDIDKTPVRRLSGGNVQKVLLGREIEASPQVIITAYPVRGLDINSSYLIYDILSEQKKNGVGVMFVGEDIDVMMGLCDRIAIICQGKLSGIVQKDEATKEEIGLMMTGATLEEIMAKKEAQNG